MNLWATVTDLEREFKVYSTGKVIFEEIIAKNFLNLAKVRYLQIQAQQTPNRVTPKKSKPRHVIIKWLITR